MKTAKRTAAGTTVGDEANPEKPEASEKKPKRARSGTKKTAKRSAAAEKPEKPEKVLHKKDPEHRYLPGNKVLPKEYHEDNSYRRRSRRVSAILRPNYYADPDENEETTESSDDEVEQQPNKEAFVAQHDVHNTAVIDHQEDEYNTEVEKKAAEELKMSWQPVVGAMKRRHSM
jgi:hypothetical protein